MNADGEYEIDDRVYFREEGPTAKGTVIGFDGDGDPIVKWDDGGVTEAFYYSDLRPVRSKS